MNGNFLYRSVVGAILLLASGFVTAQQDQHLILNVPVAGTATGSVDVLFRDFSTATGLGDYAWIQNTIEVQVNSSGLTNQQLQSLFLNFNPNLDINKLAFYWTGEPMPVPGIPDNANTFGMAGTKPSDIAIASNGFYAGGGQLFDIFVAWNQPSTFSKLLLVYDDSHTDIGFSDFFLPSATAPFFTPPGYGPLLAGGALIGPSGTIVAVPEPSMFATLGLGLIALGLAAWRRKA
jgi:hypothetical protein